jgi:hypothetical protein
MGILTGAVYVLLTFMLYSIDPAMLVSFWKTLPFLVMIGLLCVSAYLERQERQGIFPFKDALKTVFTVYVISETIWQFSNYMLFNYIDPSLPQTLKQLTLGQLEQMKNLFSEEDFQNMRKGIERENYQITPSAALFAWGVWMIIGFLFSLVIAAVFRNSPAPAPDSSPLPLSPYRPITVSSSPLPSHPTLPSLSRRLLR